MGRRASRRSSTRPRAWPSATSAAARRSWSSARSRPGPAWVRSVDLGSLRLTTRLLADSDPPSAEAVEAARAAAAEAFEAVVPPVAQIGLAAGGTARALRRVVGTLDADGLAEAVAELSQLKRAKITKRYNVPPPRANDAARRRDPLRRGAAAARPALRARRRRRARRLGARALPRLRCGLRLGRRVEALEHLDAVGADVEHGRRALLQRLAEQRLRPDRRGRRRRPAHRGCGRARARPPRRRLRRARRPPRPAGRAPRRAARPTACSATYGLERIRLKSRSASWRHERLGLSLPALVERPQGVVFAVPGLAVARPRVADEIDDHAQASSAARSSSRQASGSSARASARRAALTLDQASRRRRPRPSRASRRAGRAAAPRRRSRPGGRRARPGTPSLLDELPRRLADLGLGQLGRVARALAEDAGPVQLLVRRVRPELSATFCRRLNSLAASLRSETSPRWTRGPRAADSSPSSSQK